MYIYFVFTEVWNLTDEPSHSQEMGPELRDSSQVTTDKCNPALKAHYDTTGRYVNINL